LGDSAAVPDENLMHAKWAASYVPVRDAKVLVVGCNTGLDVRNFVELGAKEVWGVDVVEEIGRDFAHPRARYLRTSVEAMDVPDDSFDLVFTFATMEHVPGVARAFAEMARVTRPGGWIYSVASPLWNSPYGHHKADLFRGHPWVHLLLTRDEICELARRENIVPADGGAIEAHVDYMLDPAFFNKAPAAAYARACANLPGFAALRNEFDSPHDAGLDPDTEARLARKGYPRAEVLAVTHVFVGQKIGSGPLTRIPGAIALWRMANRARAFLSKVRIFLRAR
jgi:SAM-dependent methyltransferase